jgi:hypothetical protein
MAVSPMAVSPMAVSPMVANPTVDNLMEVAHLMVVDLPMGVVLLVVAIHQTVVARLMVVAPTPSPMSRAISPSKKSPLYLPVPEPRLVTLSAQDD